jgi:hypothetical protein
MLSISLGALGESRAAVDHLNGLIFKFETLLIDAYLEEKEEMKGRTWEIVLK